MNERLVNCDIVASVIIRYHKLWKADSVGYRPNPQVLLSPAPQAQTFIPFPFRLHNKVVVKGIITPSSQDKNSLEEVNVSAWSPSPLGFLGGSLWAVR